MHFLAHLSYGYILANLVAFTLGKTISPEYNIMIIFFSLVPDIDQVYDFVKQLIQTGKYSVPATHHEVVTHWPIIYVPLIIIAVATMNPFFIIAAGAIYLHLIMDTFFCNQGIRWLYPFSNKWFNIYAKETRKKKGLEWNKTYSKLFISKVDKWAFIAVLIHATILII